MKKILLTGIGAALLLCSCNEKKQEEIKKEDIPPAKTAEIKMPEPIHVYSNDTVTVKAYDYDGLEYFMTQKDDTTYVVNFWATWCAPCVAELPYFEEINAKYKSSRVKVLLVSLDMHKKVESDLLPFIKNRNLKSDVVVLRDPDANTWIRKVDTTWSGALPATVIYNKKVRKFYERSFTYEELEKEISKFK